MVKFVWAEKAAWTIQKSMGKSFGWCSNWYRGKVSKELKKYGLRYDDLYDEMHDFDIMEALHRLPTQVTDYRYQRLKRAMDCGFKHKYLDKKMQAKQTPFEFYLQDTLAQVKRERIEREAQGSAMPYQREMP
ncbi:cytochrome b-c1 complex subunit 7-2, mitochondrial [Physcomitrium patens]|uniref:Complex III subunit VII n=1 Tax=Physcomitrium patens TaxID=3218 RepID=A0A2K1JZ13_PHYPA|nr:cytochrome b-c1 complex subunit 7-2-like [Physcomitrium patens]PNR46763.1 hypothetical protein PHYPA_013883 [Physcomitrium patens]|eukprot:XP_024386767.1 cytochrome b-c1 complex subunit 7-2-like [Physcomitrella patens]